MQTTTTMDDIENRITKFRNECMKAKVQGLDVETDDDVIEFLLGSPLNDDYFHYEGVRVYKKAKKQAVKDREAVPHEHVMHPGAKSFFEGL